MENQREKERLLGDFSLLGSAVEELLRFTAPVETAIAIFGRVHRHDGTRIRCGDVIFPLIASANRDAQKFAEPDRLDVARKWPFTASIGCRRLIGQGQASAISLAAGTR